LELELGLQTRVLCDESRETEICPEGMMSILLNHVVIEVHSLVGLVGELVPKLELFSHQKRQKHVKLFRLKAKQKLVEPKVL
jgi:hypothetical protein